MALAMIPVTGRTISWQQSAADPVVPVADLVVPAAVLVVLVDLVVPAVVLVVLVVLVAVLVDLVVPAADLVVPVVPAVLLVLPAKRRLRIPEGFPHALPAVPRRTRRAQIRKSSIGSGR